MLARRALASSARDATRPRLKLVDEQVEESFVRGGQGCGGSALNTASNTVRLTHTPTGITVKCKATRYLERNREIARKVLADRVEHALDPATSRMSAHEERVRRRNAKRRSRARRKYGTLDADADADADVGGAASKD